MEQVTGIEPALSAGAGLLRPDPLARLSDHTV